MDSLYLEELNQHTFWSEPPPLLPLIQTSFRPYTRSTQVFSSSSEHPRQNVHKRVINYLRTIPPPTKTIPILQPQEEFHKERSYRHMINERLRRRKQNHTYSALHSMLPPGTKLDKVSILQMAGLHLRELQRAKEALGKRNRELEDNVGRWEGAGTVKLRRQNPVSGIDSMIGALKCMKSMGLKAIKIRAQFSVAEFLAVVEVEPKIEGHVKDVIENAIDDVNKKVMFDIHSTQWAC